MRHLTILLTLLIMVLFLGRNQSYVDKSQMVNPLLGDISYERKFGHQPDQTTDNNLRIRTHLEYAENILRSKSVPHLSPELQTKRNHLLDLLNDYWTNGVFPKNYDHADQRKPCFIDKDGTICAVGYLLEQTTSRHVAEEINSKYKYEEFLAMNTPIVDNWISTSGLTKEEFAMIQPTYGPTPVYTNNYISPAYGISSSILSGFNLSLNTINGIQIANGSVNNAIPIVGLITGTGQVVMGSAMFPKKWYNLGVGITNESQRTLSMVNIGLGASTMILSTWNLITNRTPKDKQTTWNIQSVPMPDNKTGVAFNLTHQF